MQTSPIGILICGAILLVVYYMRGSVVTCLMASLPFGATAMVTLNSLGGSSPLIYTFFAALLIVTVIVRRKIWQDLGIVFGRIAAAWIVCGLMAYAVIGAWIYPRLFAGETSAFVTSRTMGGVFEVPLEPISGNITQTGYFILGGLTFIALCVLLVRRKGLDDIRQGFFLWCGLHTGMGLVDFLGKMAGLGDVLSPIRTASYAMLTEVEEAGFSRIAGAYSEASAFGGTSLACLAFTFTYWRMTKSRLALALTMTLLLLVLLSTSSTAYVGLTLLSIPVVFSVTRSLLSNRLSAEELFLLLLVVACVLMAITISLYDAKSFDPFFQLIDRTVINKAASSSGEERAYWNYKSLQSFFDTSGLGIGLGSSRASSWPIAVLSQLGAVGALALAALVAMLFRRPVGYGADAETDAIISSARACGLASLVSGSIASGTADPGMTFFISLAIISATRHSRNRLVHRTSRDLMVPQTG